MENVAVKQKSIERETVYLLLLKGSRLWAEGIQWHCEESR